MLNGKKLSELELFLQLIPFSLMLIPFSASVHLNSKGSFISPVNKEREEERYVQYTLVQLADGYPTHSSWRMWVIRSVNIWQTDQEVQSNSGDCSSNEVFSFSLTFPHLLASFFTYEYTSLRNEGENEMKF